MPSLTARTKCPDGVRKALDNNTRGKDSSQPEWRAFLTPCAKPWPHSSLVLTADQRHCPFWAHFSITTSVLTALYLLTTRTTCTHTMSVSYQTCQPHLCAAAGTHPVLCYSLLPAQHRHSLLMLVLDVEFHWLAPRYRHVSSTASSCFYTLLPDSPF